MGLFSAAASCLLTPLQTLVVFFAPHAALPLAPAAPAKTAQGISSQRAVSERMVSQGMVSRRMASQPMAAVHAAKPYGVVKVRQSAETNLRADRAGRMVMSGRFADVCAELDRMAALQTRAA